MSGPLWLPNVGAEPSGLILPSGLQAGEGEPDSQQSRRSWRGQDLSTFVNGSYKPALPTVGARADGIGVLYPGRMSTVAAESEAGKTWFAMILVLQELIRGNHVVYIDFEDEAAGVVGRLLPMGATIDDLLERFHYIRPEEPLGVADFADLAEVLSLEPTLAVVDGVTEGMSLHGLNINDNKDVAVFGRKVLRPLQDAGPAVFSLDHVVKSSDSRGRYAIGGVHKLNGLNGVMYLMENIHPFGIGVKGRTRITIAKDRPGQLRKESLPNKSGLYWFADLVVDATEPNLIEAVLYPPIEQAAIEERTAEQEATSKQEAEIEGRKPMVLAVLAKAKSPLTMNEVTALVSGRASFTRQAVTRLVHANLVVETAGPNRSKLHSLPEQTGDKS
ncbi:AAA family ATPase [Streptomyces sp. NPDC006290]|uniref:AAA family ATPase n=1 Tax=Streptomyces sp. NPDC006290 TaxID=3156745 RepID=UPI0033B1BBD8